MQEFDIAGIGRTGRHQAVEDIADLVDLADRDTDLVGHAEAGEPLLHSWCRRRVDRLNIKTRSLDVFLLDAGGLQRGEHAGHRPRVGVACFLRGLGARGDAARYPCMIRGRTDAALADHDDARLRRRLCVVGAGGKRRSTKDNGEERGSAQKRTPSRVHCNCIGEMQFIHNRSPFVAGAREQTHTLIAKRRQNCGGSATELGAGGAGHFVRNRT